MNTFTNVVHSLLLYNAGLTDFLENYYRRESAMDTAIGWDFEEVVWVKEAMEYMFKAYGV